MHVQLLDHTPLSGVQPYLDCNVTSLCMHTTYYHETNRMTTTTSKIYAHKYRGFVVELTIAPCEIERHDDLVLNICARDDAVHRCSLQSCLYEVLYMAGGGEGEGYECSH